MTEHHIAFHPDVHLCREHRSIFRASQGFELHLAFQRELIERAIAAPAVLERQGQLPSGHYEAGGIAATLVELSPLCCLLGDVAMAKLCVDIGITPCAHCLWRVVNEPWRFAEITCAICSNHRWHPAPS